MSQTAKKEKKGFTMPPMLFLMLGLILFMCLLTYIIPAGQFAADETGALIGDSFAHLPAQTPVNPWQALMMVLQGTQNSALVMSLLLFGGATTGIVLDSGCIDDLINWAVYKLQDKGVTVLVPVMFFMMSMLGSFGGGDQLVAIIPVGILFAKKLKLDPVAALIVTFYANLVGFATGPTKLMTPQLMMDVPVYSGFGLRFIVSLVCTAFGILFAMQYCLKIAKDPSKSALGHTDWLKDTDSDVELKEVPFNAKAVLCCALFLGQYAVIVYMITILNMGNAAMVAVQLIVSVSIGIIYGMKAEDISRSFGKGCGGMAFVSIVIGFAGTMSLVMRAGNSLHTIVYYSTMPLRGLNKGLTTVGLSIIIMGLDAFIPSASSKAAILMPIVKPMTEALGITPQVAVSAFQFGDGFMNILTPALGWTVGALEVAGVPFDKWFKWALPSCTFLSILCWVILYFMALANWTGGM